MYQFSYAEVLEDDPKDARDQEHLALDRAVQMLRLAQNQGARSREAVDALLFLRQVWAILLEDLAGAGNALPETLRASLISIGIWVMKEAEQIRLEQSDNFPGLIAINEIIRDGLIRATSAPELAT